MKQIFILVGFSFWLVGCGQDPEKAPSHKKIASTWKATGGGEANLFFTGLKFRMLTHDIEIDPDPLSRCWVSIEVDGDETSGSMTITTTPDRFCSEFAGRFDYNRAGDLLTLCQIEQGCHDFE